MQVIYPVTVCTPIDILPGRFMVDAPPRGSGPRATQVKIYKLSAFEGQPLTTPFGCQKRGGPFIAKITRTIACNNATSCSMEILGVPSCAGCASFAWSGDNCQVDNRPAEVQFIGEPSAGKATYSPCNARSNCGSTPPPPNP